MSREWSNGLFSCFEDFSTCKVLQHTPTVATAAIINYRTVYFIFCRYPRLVLSMLCVWKECRAAWRELRDVCPVAVCAAAGHFLPCVSSWKDPRTKGHPGKFYWRSAVAMVLPSLCVDTGSQGTCTLL